MVVDDPHVIFYAGFVLKTKNQLPIGTFCVIDTKPRKLNEGQLKSLMALRNQAMSLLEIRKREFELVEKVKKLEQFTYTAAQDLQKPLQTIADHIKIMEEDYGVALGDQGKKHLKTINDGTDRIRALVNGLSDYSQVAVPAEEKR